MKLKSISITSATALNFDLDISARTVFFCGRNSDLVLDLIREIIGDHGAENDPDRFDDGHFVIHSDILMDGKGYDLCYIRNADFLGDSRLGVNFRQSARGFSEDDTLQFLKECRRRNKDESNILKNKICISDSSDDRPIFVYGYFDRLDESIDPMPFIEGLAVGSRQVFISVSAGYPADSLICDDVQVVRL